MFRIYSKEDGWRWKERFDTDDAVKAAKVFLILAGHEHLDPDSVATDLRDGAAFEGNGYLCVSDDSPHAR